MTFSHLSPQVSAEQAISFFKTLLGADYVLTDPKDLKVWGSDWTKFYEPKPLCVLKPANTLEVSKILQYCHDHELPVTPSGGRTGLCAGAVATSGEVVLSLARMNKITKIDSVGLTLETEAGVTTETIQDAAKKEGLFFPLDLAAKGSCHIGGNIATNAGGVKLIRYGGMREQVLGLEVVLANGEILDMMTSLRKNNSGYDLKHIFIGSEGTLGVVTRAVIKLMPPPRSLELAVMAVQSFADIPKILRQCNLMSASITAFEFFTDVAHQIVLKHLPGARSPFAQISPFYVLLEVEQTDPSCNMENILAKLFDLELISDATIAHNSAQFKDLWSLRENITESIAAHGQVRKNDISLPIDSLDLFVADLEKLLTSKKVEDLELVLFGHIGDGNLHINYVAPKSQDSVAFKAQTRAIEVEVFKLLTTFKGSISAEHGIGLTKKEDLHFTRSPSEIAWMKKMKQLFDTKGILNPGKIFD